MQTIGKTNNKMDFPLNWTDILLKSIPGKTNYTIDVKIGTKRILTDNQDQRDITKKRRKQSNPTRITSNENNRNDGFDTKLISSKDNKNELNRIEPANVKAMLHEQPSSSVPLNLIKSENQNTFSTDERRKIFLSNNNIQQNESTAEVQETIISSNQQLSQTNVYVEKKDSSEYSSCISSINVQPCTPVTNAGQSSVQIFNPEAFCDQCNKEFCNKYFLKTHKANKHGVYFDNNSNSSILDQMDKSKMASLLVTSDFSPNCTNEIFTGPSTSTMFKSPAVFPQSLLNTNTYMLKNIFNNQTRAFCNICQKEFCNKYFVKRHKAKIHGIVDDGDYRLTIDDMPLNYKANLQIKNEDSENNVPENFDKYEKTVSPSFDDTQRLTSELSNRDEILFIKDTKISIENNEPLMKSVIVETPCDYNIKTENSKSEHILKYESKLPPNVYNSVNNCSNNSEQATSIHSTHMTSTNYEQVIYPNEFSKSNIENIIIQKSTELSSYTSTTPINLITNNDEQGFNGVLMNANNMGKQTVNELNSTKVDNANDVETDKFTKNEDVQIELMNKNKLFTFNNMFYKINGDAPEYAPQYHVCNSRVDGSLKTHMSDKHENLSGDPLTDGSVEAACNEGSPVGHSCFRCHLTFDSDAPPKPHSEPSAECNVKGEASTSSKNSAENDECDKPVREMAGERRPSAMLSSFCKICNKELCNKYFMKTHMQRMHGISIENGNHIGGVVCDVCNKELCSKYFLRVHKQNSHGILEPGAVGTGQKFWPDPAAEHNGHPHAQLLDEPDANGHRYYKHYTEACGICFRRFRSSKWLMAHLLNDHGDEGRAHWKHAQHHGGRADDEGTANRNREQVVRVDCEIEAAPVADGDVERNDEQMKQYRCSYCPFATSILSFLFVHEKFHVAGNNGASAEHGLGEDTSADTVGNGHGHDAFAAEVEQQPPPAKDHREPFIMQSFFLENCSASPSVKAAGSSGRSDSFHSSLVYLPVKEKLTSTVNVFFKLTPT